MANRTRGHGLSADCQRRTKAKYNAEDEAQACQWIETVLGRDVFGGKTGEDAVHEVLADGKVLVELANELRNSDPSDSLGPPLKANNGTKPFLMMENISKYLTFCGKQLGVPNGDQFQTVDLYEKQNMALVISQIHATGRRSAAKGLNVPDLGPKEATANKREFSKEQLKAGKNEIGLQMGTNKLASQAGDHFGRPRQIAGVDAYK